MAAARKTIRDDKLTLLLADNHTLLRSALRHLLISFGGINVLEETDCTEEAVEAAVELAPEIVVMDLSPPLQSALEVLGELRRRVPQSRVLVLSAYHGRQHVQGAMKLGAQGFLSKHAAPVELQRALATLRAGKRYISTGLTENLLDDETPSSADSTRLSPRQRQVLQLIATGHTTREIASILGVSIKTVETHRARLQQMLGIRGSYGLLRYAMQANLDESADTNVAAAQVRENLTSVR